jgi:hypothetical protein
MSVNPVSQSPAAAVVSLNQNQAQQKPASQATLSASQQDAVHLSSEAKAAAGDVDHDGDSH